MAELAGVSTAVVSYVVNNGPKRVAPETADKVRRAIDTLGYRPNAVARSLKIGSIQTLGLVVPDLSNPYFAAVTRAVERAALAKGFALLTTSSDLDVDIETAHLRVLEARGVDGVLVSSCVQGASLLQQALPGLPMVFLDRSSAPGIATVGVDSFQGAYQAVTHLIEHGHRRVGLIVGEDEFVTGDGDRISGWKSALSAAGLPEGPVEFGDFSLTGGYLAGRRMLARADSPEAVFITSDQQAMGFLRAAGEADKHVPRDIALVAFDGIPESAFSFPSLTTMAQPVNAMAEAAVELLISGAGQGGERTKLSFNAELTIRESCGCPRRMSLSDDESLSTPSGLSS
ncbi:LacI family DNA-binding transcriptional regulator [Psychromicrobium lacuslunae]|uniref:LacI family DNA-binding transcriptional regulator n=1 Tax=Psychromicrobium lacuslunae TaxID=1618207 RepID=UPI001F2C17A3|nr:LacI family DNA-binding transcriptional regulator [Psychromicrobium lacuslunae]